MEDVTFNKLLIIILLIIAMIAILWFAYNYVGEGGTFQNIFGTLTSKTPVQ